MQKKNLQKDPLNYHLWKVKKIHGNSVKNESARAKKLEGGGAFSACLGLKVNLNFFFEFNTRTLCKSFFVVENSI